MEKRTIEISLETAKEWYNSDIESLKQVALQAFKKEELEKITYTDIKNKLNFGTINIAYSTEKQYQKLLAINKLMNVAKYFNKDWKPNYTNWNECKYFIYIDINNDVSVSANTSQKHMSIYFKNKKDAEKAIEILGEDTIRLILSTDW